MVDTQENNPNRVRNCLVGFATLLLIIAAIAPWIITDKPNLRTTTTPILQPEVVTQQNQVVVPSDDVDDNFTHNISDVPYLSGSDQDLNSSVSSDIVDDTDDSTNITQPSMSQQESKPYMIQLTALKNKQKIEELIALLRLNNYSVRTIPDNPEPNQLIKLQVGPYAKKEQAEQVIINLNNLTKLEGIIITN
ncbi:SPOR domain-containing protein [Gilliamella bombi]|uniref:SPOR domain-containing protein n=1 Tax=Gilliamella bombi TaxID=1908521 RepID=UPI000A16A502|nr:SPOR domain-containing protein [Gilliamella bombi]